MEIRIISSPVSIRLVEKMAKQQFGNLVKATVDVKKKIMALGGELHADEEQLLLEQGSNQSDLWGINLYPPKFGTSGFIEFDSMINIRPSQGNMSREVENPQTKKLIKQIINGLIVEKR